MLTPCEAGFYCLALPMQTATDNVCEIVEYETCLGIALTVLKSLPSPLEQLKQRH